MKLGIATLARPPFLATYIAELVSTYMPFGCNLGSDRGKLHFGG